MSSIGISFKDQDYQFTIGKRRPGASHTLGNYSVLGRDDLISSYQVFANCLVMYFGYHLSKPKQQGGLDPRERRLMF